MKRFFIFIFILFTGIMSYGCKAKDDFTEFSTEYNNIDDDIKYTVEQIFLSKTFQTTDPSVDIINKNGNIKIKAALGLTECSSVEVEKVTLNNNNVKIHVRPNYKEDELQISVPQIVLDIPSSYFKNINNYNFELVNEDPNPLKLKFTSSDVLSKINSQFKISSNRMPEISLERDQENHLIWNIFYKGIFDRNNNQIPIIDLDIMVDSSNGEIIEFEKSFIASSVDNGSVLSYFPNESIVYKKSILDSDKNKTKEELWSYDFSSEEESILFSSDFNISAAKFSPKNNHIAFLEENNGRSNLYIIDRSNKRPYQISFKEDFNPRYINWDNDNSLFLIENKSNSSKIVKYNLIDDQIIDIAQINKVIEFIEPYKDEFIVVQSDDESTKFKKNIFKTNNWIDFSFIDNGSSPEIINDNLFYVQKDNKSEVNQLYLYNLKKNSKVDHIASNISNYNIISKDLISYVRKNPENNLDSMYKYNLKSSEEEQVLSLVGEKSYYDSKHNQVYSNITLPFESEKQDLIYMIDVEKIMAINNMNKK